MWLTEKNTQHIKMSFFKRMVSASSVLSLNLYFNVEKYRSVGIKDIKENQTENKKCTLTLNN